MDDLPVLPFKKILSYLSLRDRLRLGAVSRSCREKVHNSRVKSLCFSSRPCDFILGKSRWVSGVFAQNFINSTKFPSFFDAYSHSILSSLKHLRLCDLYLHAGRALVRALNSFSQLEELHIVRVKCNCTYAELKLPMLTIFHLEEATQIPRITLNAPRLRVITLQKIDNFSLEIVHDESVEKLIQIDIGRSVRMMKSLKYIYFQNYSNYSTIYSALSQLKHLNQLKHLQEIHTNKPDDVSKLFTQKERYGRADLKIYLYGLLLNGPDDPAINAFGYNSDYLSSFRLVCLAENRSRLADEIPFYHSLHYSNIERVAPGLEVDVLKRCTNLNQIQVYPPVQDIQRFLDLLKNCARIVELMFNGDHPQDLFDRLPEHCAVQKLTLSRPPSDLAFLFRLKNLINLKLEWSIDAELVRKAFNELPFLSIFNFQKDPSLDYNRYHVEISTDIPKRIPVWTQVGRSFNKFSDLNSAIQSTFSPSKIKTRKRRAEQLE